MKPAWKAPPRTVSRRIVVLAAFALIWTTNSEATDPQPSRQGTEQSTVESTAKPHPDSKAGELYFDWDAVPDASGYTVQVKDADDNTVIDQRVTDHRFDFVLPPGNYQQRVGALNRFGKMSAWSDWQPFRVISRSSPELTLDPPGDIVLDERFTHVVLRGKGFTPETEYFLASKRGRTRLRAERADVDSVTLMIDSQDLLPGRYDLLVENPGSELAITKDFLRVPGQEPPDQEPAVTRAKESSADQNHEPAWKAFLPGVVQLERGDTYRGSALAGSFVSFGILAGQRVWSADRMAKETQRTLQFRIFHDPVVAAALTPLYQRHPEMLYLGWMSWNKYNADRSRYTRYRGDVLRAGAAAGLIIGIHAFDLQFGSSHGRTALRIDLAILPVASADDGSAWFSVVIRM